jgi:ABC-type transporter Mla subunit MlaD
MSTSTTATLEVLLSAQTAAFNNGMNQAINQIKRTQDQLKQQGSALNSLNGQFKSVTDSIGLMTKGLAALGGLGYLKGLIDAADAASDMGDAFGIAIGRIYGMSNAIQEAGGKGDGLQQMLQKISNTVDDAFEGNEKAQASFKRLGITMESIASLSIDQIYQKIAKALAGIEDPAKRNALAMELMGKSAIGTDWEKHNKVLEETRQKYEDMTPALQRAADYSEKLSVATKQFGTIATAVLGGIPDTVRKVAQGFRDLYDVIAGNKTLEEAMTVATKDTAAATDDVAKKTTTFTRTLKESESALKERTKALEDANKIIAQGVISQIEWESKMLDAINPMREMTREWAKLDEAMASGRINGDQYFEILTKITDQGKQLSSIKDPLDEIGVAMGGILTNGVTNLVDGFFEMKSSFADTAADFLKNIAKMIAQTLVLKAIQQSLGGTAFGSWLGIKNANGNAFSSAIGLPYGIYNQPTYFNMPGNGPLTKFAKGGVLGEAGPEAIMPLRRGGDGKLGVSAAPVNIEINNYSNAKVETAETTGEDGSKRIVMTIRSVVKDMFGDGSLDKTMKVGYGLSRAAS